MVALLILVATCLFGITLTAVFFAIPMQGGTDQPEVETRERPVVSYGHFFLDERTAAKSGLGVPHPSLLRQLEEHVRREHMVAEEFLRGPSEESLHASNEPPRWN